MSDQYLTPSYLETDFNTMKEKLKELMAASDTFKDYNYEGANITMLMELVSYLGDLSTFYTNLLSKNVYDDTADVYEAVHRLATQKGYNPIGYRSGQIEMTVTLALSANDSTVLDTGDVLIVRDNTVNNNEKWFSLNSGEQTPNNSPIYYTLTDEKTITVTRPSSAAEASGAQFSFTMNFREGSVVEIDYTGNDVVDNQIILPFYNFDYGVYPYDTPAIQVLVNDVEWTRVSDFYDTVSGLNDYGFVTDSTKTTDNDNVFRFVYDKYQRYVIEFSSARNIPVTSDDINVKLLKSNSTNGSIGALTFNLINPAPSDINLRVYNSTKDEYLTLSRVKNIFASTGAADPQSVEEIKSASKGLVHSQVRNVTKADYKSHLESDSTIVTAYAWGEQDENPYTTTPPLINVLNYNKVFLSMVPNRKSSYTSLNDNYEYFENDIFTQDSIIWDNRTTSPAVSGYIWKPVAYIDTFKEEVLTFLEPRKATNVYEVFILPNIVYFKFELGLRVKRVYNYESVKEAMLDKLAYYFTPEIREFNEEINFMEIHNFILDTSITHSSFSSSQIKGINNLVFRDIVTYTTGAITAAAEIVYEDDGTLRYPLYSQSAKESHVDNTLRPIQLGPNQFPALALDMCTVVNEG